MLLLGFRSMLRKEILGSWSQSGWDWSTNLTRWNLLHPCIFVCSLCRFRDWQLDQISCTVSQVVTGHLQDFILWSFRVYQGVLWVKKTVLVLIGLVHQDRRPECCCILPLFHLCLYSTVWLDSTLARFQWFSITLFCLLFLVLKCCFYLMRNVTKLCSCAAESWSVLFLEHPLRVTHSFASWWPLFHNLCFMTHHPIKHIITKSFIFLIMICYIVKKQQKSHLSF